MAQDEQLEFTDCVLVNVEFGKEVIELGIDDVVLSKMLFDG